MIYNLAPMHRTAILLTVVLLLGVGLCGPAFQNVDPWDHFPDSGDSLVLILAMAGMWFGMTLCLALLIPLLFQQRRTARSVLVSAHFVYSDRMLSHAAGWFDSPLTLRI